MSPSAGLMFRLGEASGFGAAVSLIYSLIIDNNQCLSKVLECPANCQITMYFSLL